MPKILAIVLLFGLLQACSKVESPGSVLVGPQTPTTQLEQAGTVTMAPAVVVPLPAGEDSKSSTSVVVTAEKPKATTVRKSSPDEELTARAKALVNSVRADCLTDAVDRKLDWDVATNTVHDLGNVLTAPVCKEYDLKASPQTLALAVKFLKQNDKKAQK